MFDDFAPFFDEFGEQITYTPRSGRPRRVNAVIDRGQLKTYGQQGNRGGGIKTDIVAVTDIWIANHSTKGVTTIDTGGDTVMLPRRVGGDDVEQSIAEVLGDSTAEFWHVRLR